MFEKGGAWASRRHGDRNKKGPGLRLRTTITWSANSKQILETDRHSVWLSAGGSTQTGKLSYRQLERVMFRKRQVPLHHSSSARSVLSSGDAAPRLDSQLLHQHCWPWTSICSPDLLACTQTQNSHTLRHIRDIKLEYVYLDTQAWARHRSLLTISRLPLRFCRCEACSWKDDS